MGQAVKKLVILIAFLLCAQSAWGLTEVPGNGFDDDGVGGDQACAAPDADCDGYTTDGTGLGKDCNDSDRKDFPGQRIWTSGTSWKICQANGTYTAPSNACPDNDCWFFDPTSGNDANAGTSAGAAFQHLTCGSSYASGAPACNIHSSIGCGDHLFLLPGTYTTGQFHNEGGIYSWVGLLLKNKSCAGNPITIDFIGAAIIDGTGVYSGAADGAAIFIDQSPGTIIRMNNLGEIRKIFSGYGQENGAIRVDASDGIELSGGYLHDNTGDGNANGSAIYFGGTSRNINAHHLEVVDQLWSGVTTRSNVCLWMQFSGSGRISYSSFRYTSGASANCGVRIKQGSCNISGGVCTDSMRFDHNKISKAGGIMLASPNSRIDHNIFADCDYSGTNACALDRGNAWMQCDSGNRAYDGANIYEYNTALNCGGYSWVPTNDYDMTTGAGCTDCGTFGSINNRFNVFSDNAGSYSVTGAFAMIDPYGTDSDFTSIVSGGKVSENNNCYYNSSTGTLEWSWYGRVGATLLGNDWTYAQLVSGGYCATCANTNPTLNARLEAGAASCTSYGWQNGWITAAPSTNTTTNIVPINWRKDIHRRGRK